jgi:hypothetical protein
MDLFNSSRMNTAILDQLGECHPRCLPANWIEAGQQHGLRCVVDHHVDTGDLFEGTDVAALATDDAALHFVRGQLQDADHTLRGLLAGHPLDGVDDDPTRPLLALGERFALQVAD